jgi:hypothetical protein
MGDNKKKAKWTEKQTQYTLGGGLIGLAAGVLLRRLIDGSKATKWSDYLLWGGIGAGVGAGGGYLAGSDRTVTESDKGFIRARLAANQKKLEEARAKVDAIRAKEGYSEDSPWWRGAKAGGWFGGAALGIDLAAEGAGAAWTKVKNPKAKAILALPATVNKLLDAVVPNRVKARATYLTVLPGAGSVIAAANEKTDPKYNIALENMEKLQDTVNQDKLTLKQLEALDSDTK